MGGNGTAVLDLGPFPGVSDGEFTITGLTGIADASKVDVWIIPADTSAGWTANGCPFNGSTALVATSFSPAFVDSKIGIISAWLQIDDRTNNDAYWFNSWITSATGAHIFKGFKTLSGSRTINTLGYGPSGTNLDVNLASQLIPGKEGDWVHVLASWDIANNVGSLFLNDIQQDVTLSRIADENIPWSGIFGAILGATRDRGFYWKGAIAEFYLAPAQYLDFTTTANRRKFNQFVGDRLLPVSLGTTGSTPTGTAPKVYLHLDDGEAAANFKLNRAGAGDFQWELAPIVADKFVQSAVNFIDTTATTLSVTLNGVTAGNGIVAFVGYDIGGTFSQVSDGTVYTQQGATVTDSSDNKATRAFTRQNSPGGTVTVTLTMSATGTMLRLAAAEVAGSASAFFDQATGQTQSGPNGVDSILSGSVTPAVNGTAIAWTYNCTDVTTVATAGTGFTQQNSDARQSLESAPSFGGVPINGKFTQSVVQVARNTHIVTVNCPSSGTIGESSVPSFGVPLLTQPGHTADEHEIDPPLVRAYSPSAAGTSMKIRLFARPYPALTEQDYKLSHKFANNNTPLIYGKWNIGYAWA